MSRSFRLGIFIFVTSAILATGVFLIGNQQMRFRSTYRLQTHFQTVAGLESGADVRVGGVRTGTVKQIDLPRQPGGDLTVMMELDRATHGVVNRASVASVKSEGLLGDKYVEVSFGQPNAGELRNGDTIGSEPPIDFGDLVKKADQILDTSNTAVENVEGTTRNLQEVTSRINEGKGTVGALINDPTMYQRASAGVTAFQENMEALKHNFLLRGFFKQRGYEDESELAKHRIARLPEGTPLEDYVLDASKIFHKNDSAKLSDPKLLATAGHFLESNPFGVAVVVASTGALGETEKSRTLSEARAMVVREYLADHFRVDDTRVKTLALGKTFREGDNPKIEIVAYKPAVRPSSSARGANSK